MFSTDMKRMKRRNFLAAALPLPFLLQSNQPYHGPGEHYSYGTNPDINTIPCIPPFGMRAEDFDTLYWEVVTPDLRDFSLDLENIQAVFLDGWNAWRFRQSFQLVPRVKNSITTWMVTTNPIIAVSFYGMITPQVSTLKTQGVFVTAKSRVVTRWSFADQGRAQEFIGRVRLRRYSERKS